MANSPSPLDRFLRFLGQVQFTMFLLLGGAIAMTVGTIIESRADAATARAAVYGTLWFDAYLFMVVVNLVVAVINRIPIRRHQWAFVLTHLSIVLLLFGAWVSRTFGYEGQLAVAEGRQEARIWLDGAELRAQWQGADPQTFPLGANRGLAGRVLAHGSAGQPGLRIAQFVPHGKHVVDLIDASGEGGPGIEFHVEGMGIHKHDWLIGDHRSYRRKDLGPVEIELLVARSPEFLKERSAARASSAVARIRIQPLEGEPLVIELPEKLDQALDLGGGTQAKVAQYLPHAQVRGGLVNNPSAPANPAAVVEIWQGERRESHTVFSQFPDFNILKGRDKESPLVTKVVLEATGVVAKPLVSVLVDPTQGQLYVQLSASVGRGEALAFQSGQTVGVGDLGLDLRVTKYLKNARMEARVEPVGSEQDGSPWMQLVTRYGGVERQDWLRYGAAQDLDLGGRPLAVSWSRHRRDLPFSLTLDDFEIEYYPGSGRPSQYQSRVKVRDEAGAETPAVISMNQPLDWMGFRLFQSHYELGGPGQPDTTILTVSYDPGVKIVYPAFILLIIGVAWYLVGSGRRRPALPIAPEVPSVREGDAAPPPLPSRPEAKHRATS